MMQRALGTGDELWLGHSRSQKLDYAMPPPDVIARIKRENAMDFKLHAFALDLSLRNMADTIPKGLKAAMEEVPRIPKSRGGSASILVPRPRTRRSFVGFVRKNVTQFWKARKDMASTSTGMPRLQPAAAAICARG